MIQLLRHHEIDFARWETCLQNARESLVYRQAWYLEVVCVGEWDALVEIQAGAYVSVFPLPVRRFLGKKKVYQPLFTQQLGLVVTSASRHTAPEEYLALAADLYGQVQYQLPWPQEAAVNLPEAWTWRRRPNFELSLGAEYTELGQNYANNLRRNLKKAGQEELILQPADAIQSLIELFQSTKGKELPELRPRHYQRLADLYAQAKQQGVGQVWEVHRQNKLLAAAFILSTEQRTTFLFGASSAEGRTHNAMAFLLDQLIQREAGSGKTFDFEGSEVPGVAKFYAGFGAQPATYVSLSLKPNPAALSWTPNVFRFLARHLR
ncbi:GNAT family N-acetyltransferase [Rufibacter roseolus]|uniref:GNAT family N-acetyltransferase n=1 Tax=Rufibacter roseolus TaxID=2817375 RepID=UPI001B300D49|nr:GNAT family N-acetyltransferase [Rufibacter roseolus]